MGFSPDSSRRIAQAVRHVEKSPRRAQIGRAAPPTIVLPSFLGITTTTITARAGKTPGSGTVQPYFFNGATLVTRGPTVKVYNWTGGVVDSPKWIEYNWMYGVFWLNGTDCSGIDP
jgi:hypothetical protein